MGNYVKTREMKKSAVRSSAPRKSIEASATPARKPASAANPKRRRAKSDVDKAIATELAPAAAIALLDRAEAPPGQLAPALVALAAGVSPATDDSKVRVQLIFEGGEVLPVEISVQAGAALAVGLSKELGTKP